MTPKEILVQWIDCFNASDAKGIVELYAENAVNHQVANAPVVGKTAIYEMFENEFATAKMVCIVENMFEDGDAVSFVFKTIKLFSKEDIGIN